MKTSTFISFLIYISLCFIPNVNATTYTTIFSGYWTNNNVWQNGVAPSLSTSDTIVIKNFIEFTHEINLNSQAFLKIDSTGALCGHDTIFSNSGSGIVLYGILECDILEVPGGQLVFNNPGSAIMTQYAHLSNGASLHSTASINVGPWFNCITKGSAVEEYPNIKFSLTPNPVSDLLNITTDEIFDKYVIYDLTGRRVQNGYFENALDVSALTDGYYILKLENKELFARKKFIKRSY